MFMWNPFKHICRRRSGVLEKKLAKEFSTSSAGVDLIKDFEGYRSEAYQDSVGVWTIGYGTIKYPSGERVKKGDVVNEAEAEIYLRHHLEIFERALHLHVKAPINQNQFDALVCWTYNLGETNLRRSTMLKELNKQNYDEVPEQMKRWNRAGGKILRGLVRRREAEAELFEKED